MDGWSDADSTRQHGEQGHLCSPTSTAWVTDTNLMTHQDEKDQEIADPWVQQDRLRWVGVGVGGLDATGVMLRGRLGVGVGGVGCEGVWGFKRLGIEGVWCCDSPPIPSAHQSCVLQSPPQTFSPICCNQPLTRRVSTNDVFAD